MQRSAEFRDFLRACMERADMSLYGLHKATGISRDILRAALDQGKFLNSIHLRKVAAALDLNHSEWERFDTGGRLTLPSEEPFWRSMVSRVMKGPFSERTRRFFEEFLQSANQDIARLAA
jgi:hypothetical protein